MLKVLLSHSQMINHISAKKTTIATVCKIVGLQPVSWRQRRLGDSSNFEANFPKKLNDCVQFWW